MKSSAYRITLRPGTQVARSLVVIRSRCAHADRWLGRRGAPQRGTPTPPAEPCVPLSRHTALDSSRLLLPMSYFTARPAQDQSLAPARRKHRKASEVMTHVCQGLTVMHLERTVGTAARFADAGVQAADRVVPTARDRGAHVDGIDSGPLPRRQVEMLEQPNLAAAAFLPDDEVRSRAELARDLR